jgi:hypothetical protein
LTVYNRPLQVNAAFSNPVKCRRKRSQLAKAKETTMDDSETIYKSETIYEFQLTLYEMLRISLVTADDTIYLDIRRWNTFNRNPRPLKSGVRMVAEATPKLRVGLKKAETRLNERLQKRRSARNK